MTGVFLRKALGKRELFHFADRAEFFSGAEEKGDTPDTGKSDYRVDDSADESVHTAAQPSDNIKTEKANTTPV